MSKGLAQVTAHCQDSCAKLLLCNGLECSNYSRKCEGARIQYYLAIQVGYPKSDMVIETHKEEELN